MASSAKVTPNLDPKGALFTNAQIAAAQWLLGTRHVDDGRPVREHVQHSFDQLARFAELGQKDPALFAPRAMQFGLNLGRAQELLGAPGGKVAWWQRFEHLCAKNDFDALQATIRAYRDIFLAESTSVQTCEAKIGARAGGATQAGVATAVVASKGGDVSASSEA